MAFDEELTRAFDTLTERLRGEVDLEVQRRTAEAIAAMAIAEPPSDPTPEPAQNEDDRASAAASAERAASAGRLDAAMRAIDAARTLTAALDALLEAARAESPDTAIWLLRGGQLQQWRPEESQSVTPPADGEGIPILIAGERVGAVVLRTTNGESGTSNDERRTTNVEIVTRYAARSLEALTAFKAARALTQQPDADRAVRTADSEAESEEDTSARRYARLLVSEIKLYHEPAVIDGCRDRDLATRLGGEIARARVMYEQRVPAHVRERADYFRTELVRTLCSGDASLLEVRT